MNIKKSYVLALAVLLSLTVGEVAPRAQNSADLIITGGNIYTLTDEYPTAEAVVVAGDRIVYVGDAAGAGMYRVAGTRWVDLEGKTMIPGLVDAHAHIKNLGRYLANVQLVGTRSVEEIRTMVDAALKDKPAGRWLRGRGWDQNDWEKKEFPTWRDLDGTEAFPVYLRRVDGHAAWVNKTALDICGITRDTPDPPGGRIHRDEKGEPTGILIDNAEELVSDRIPPPDSVELDGWIHAAIIECNRLGLTGIHDAGTNPEELDAFKRLYRRGIFTFRIYSMLDSDEEAFLDEELPKGPREYAGGRVVVRSIKVYSDGALGSRGAALFAPYSDDPDNDGLLVSTAEKMERLSLRALECGFQVCTHAIGDRGVAVVLDAYEKALKTRDVTDHRFRVEHSQIVALDDIPRYQKLGVIPSMQPTHATSDMYWAEDRVGSERIKGAYAWRSFLDDGNRLPLGSDFPVESPNPLWGIYAAVTRQDNKGWPQGGWYPEQRMSVLEAVKGFTIEAAYAGFAEDELGTIETGKLADFTVLDKDIFVIPHSEILRTTVTHTIVGGEIVYESKSSD